MKKTKRKIICFLLAVMLLFGISSGTVFAAIDWNCTYTYISYQGQVVDSINFAGIQVNSIYAPRNQIGDYDSNSTYCCAAFVKRFYDNVYGTGVYNLYNGAVPQISYGGGYFYETSNPVAGDIARGPNHWAIVKSVSGNTVTLIEQNAWNKAYTSAAVGRRIIMPESTYTYFHYSEYDRVMKWYASMTPVDIGTNVYAAIIKTDTWIHLGEVDGNVQLVNQNEVKDASDVWRFERQSDGSYVIYNCQSNNALDVTNAETTDGTNIGTYPYWGHDAQKWYIYGRWSGEYVLRPKLCDKVLDVQGGYNNYGTNIQLWTYNNTAAQNFAIYTFEPAGSSVINAKYSDSNSDTKISWTAASNATSYNLRIKTGPPDNLTTYKDVWNLTQTEYTLKLPEGYYEVYVDSCNKFSYKKSNVIKFYVAKGILYGDVNNDGALSITDATKIQSYLAGITDFTSAQTEIADINRDGKVSIADATMIQKKLVGLL